MSTQHFSRPSGQYLGESGLPNRSKYQDDSNAQPKVKISSQKVDGDLNYVIDAINQLFDTAISGILPDGSVTNAKLAPGTIGAIRSYNLGGFPADIAPGATPGVPLITYGTGTIPMYGQVLSAGIADNAVSAGKAASSVLSTMPTATTYEMADYLVTTDNSDSNNTKRVALSNVIASDAEALAGLDVLKWVTPKSMSVAIAAAAPPGGFASILRNVYTTGGTWTKNIKTLYVFVEVFGGGGAGGSGASSIGGGGGGAGGYTNKLYAVSDLSATEAYTIGAAGASASNAVGGNGGSSTFKGLTATGGTGGGYNTNVRGGNGGVGTGGDINSTGQPGNNGYDGNAAGNRHFSGNGGCTIYGAGGNGQYATATTTAQGSNGVGYGAGGAGSIGGNAGGAGATGAIIITEYRST